MSTHFNNTIFLFKTETIYIFGKTPWDVQPHLNGILVNVYDFDIINIEFFTL